MPMHAGGCSAREGRLRPISCGMSEGRPSGEALVQQSKSKESDGKGGRKLREEETELEGREENGCVSGESRRVGKSKWRRKYVGYGEVGTMRASCKMAGLRRGSSLDPSGANRYLIVMFVRVSRLCCSASAKLCQALPWPAPHISLSSHRSRTHLDAFGSCLSQYAAYVFFAAPAPLLVSHVLYPETAC